MDYRHFYIFFDISESIPVMIIWPHVPVSSKKINIFSKKLKFKSWRKGKFKNSKKYSWLDNFVHFRWWKALMCMDNRDRIIILELKQKKVGTIIHFSGLVSQDCFSTFCAFPSQIIQQPILPFGHFKKIKD